MTKNTQTEHMGKHADGTDCYHADICPLAITGERTAARKGKCECADPGCPVCKGRCDNWSNIVLNRIDMIDETGTAFCEGCADDAMESGLFSNYAQA